MGSFTHNSAFGHTDSGFLETHGRFTTIDVPGARLTEALGINDRGQIVGNFIDFNNQMHGFLNTNGIFTTIDVPGAISTTVRDINNAGLFVCSFTDAAGRTHGYVDPPSEVPEPTSLLLLASGLGGWALFRSRIRTVDHVIGWSAKA